jgi:hypothetical protein
MKLASIKWQALIFLSIMSILAVGCASQALPAKLEASKSVLSLGEHTNIECIVSNATGNSTGNFTYEWSNDGGSLEGEGEAIDWVAPGSPGTYTITAEVTGDNGERGTASITITVTDNHVPVIQDLVVTANHKYLKERKTDYLVGKDQSYNISCQAEDEDNDDLSYIWSCDKGKISGTGAQVTWKSPNVDGKVNITVTVSDSRNGTATRELLLSVVACSACTFK